MTGLSHVLGRIIVLSVCVLFIYIFRDKLFIYRVHDARVKKAFDGRISLAERLEAGRRALALHAP